MHRARARRVAAGVVVLMLAACHGSGSASFTPTSGTAAVDVKAACAALSALGSAGDVLNGVDVADPGTSLAALTKAVDAYSKALAAFALVGPTELRAAAARVRAAVLARHFEAATTERAPIDAWAARHCNS
jgi:hypothetical protein